MVIRKSGYVITIIVERVLSIYIRSITMNEGHWVLLLSTIGAIALIFMEALFTTNDKKED